MGAEQQQCGHRSGCGASKVNCTGCYNDPPWVRSQEETDYESHLSEYFGPHGDASLVYISAFFFELLKLMASSDALWFIERQEYWARDLDMKLHDCIAPIRPTLVEGYNVVVLVLLRVMRNKGYLSVPVCWVSLDPPQVLLVPSPAVFVYCVGVVLRGLHHSHIVWLIAKSEQAVHIVMCFFRRLAKRCG